MICHLLRPTALLTRVRRQARQRGYVVTAESGRGNGSHRLYVLRDADGEEVGRFVVTGHARELSWTVLSSIEDPLAHLLGGQWMEDK